MLDIKGTKTEENLKKHLPENPKHEINTRFR